MRTEDALINYGIAKTEKIKSLQRKKSDYESKEFDFHPKILKTSEEIVRRKEARSGSVRSAHSRKSSIDSLR